MINELLTRVEGLTDARNAIASLEASDLGYHERAPHEHWPIRDELLSKIDAALTALIETME